MIIWLLIAAGATLIKFFENPVMQVLGWIFVAVGGWLAVNGYQRYRKVDIVLHKVKGQYIEKASKAKRNKGWISLALNALHSRAK